MRRASPRRAAPRMPEAVSFLLLALFALALILVLELLVFPDRFPIARALQRLVGGARVEACNFVE